MNKTELINNLKSNTENSISTLPKTKIKEILEGVLATISNSIATNKSVEIGALGVLEYDYKVVKGRLEPIVRLRSNNEIKTLLNDTEITESIDVCEDTKKIFYDSSHIQSVIIGSFGKDVKQADKQYIKNGLIKITKLPLVPMKYICPIKDLNEFIVMGGYKLKKLRKVAVKKEYVEFLIPTFKKEIDGVEYEFYDYDSLEGIFPLGEIYI